ncbi:MAG: biotin synthase BioB [Candidatus Gastranaerophilales bacterium]|nr:biotin synthase BioB [Candidatus Gastranaerophilales bacterium]
MITKTIKEELLELYNLPVNILIDISSKITKEYFDNKVEFCSIISAKTGKCSENCKYCAQSSHYRTDIENHPLLNPEEIKKSAIDARNNGASKFGIVTSGKTPDKEDFELILKTIEMLSDIKGLSICCSLGIINEDQIKKLKEVGIERYHHNINTCRSYYNDICTTHSFDERINTIKLVQKYGMNICCGVIIGMGETREQRVEMAIELAELNPVSVPVNFLTPIEGTPFENMLDAIDENEILKTLAIFRIALPNARIRYAGGRSTRFSKKYQQLGIKAGVNGLLVGNYLTTTGINPDEDLELVKNSGMSVAND